VACGNREAEFRARLNRGIAILSHGNRSEARLWFESLLRDAESVGDETAQSYALLNLGVVAYHDHAYNESLALWERLTELPAPNTLSRLHPLCSLASLRTRLGLVEHAEHAVRFAKRLLNAHTPLEYVAHFHVALADVALARGNTAEAHTQAVRAIEGARRACNQQILVSAQTTLVRVALEEGDLASACATLEQAMEVDADRFHRAELALLFAQFSRAQGSENTLRAAREALERCLESEDFELLRAAHQVLAQVLHGIGELDESRREVARARELRDRVAGSLDAHVRAAYLSMPSVLALSKLDAALLVGADLSVRPLASVSRVDLIGEHVSMQALRNAYRRVARTQATVLISGESGTGKELVAAALHRESARAKGPFVAVNCAALAETLLLSELFGHEKGAFTGAATRKRGRFEVAEGGTLFLDEIGDISAKTQVALLRVLQERNFERVGGTQSVSVDVRVVCATHRDLKAMVERGEFREDLYYRLKQFQLDVPALRSRGADIELLAKHCLAKVSVERNEPAKALTADALELLASYHWPGNVRELENAMQVVALFVDSGVISASDVIAHYPEVVARTNAPNSVRSLPPPPSSFPGSTRLIDDSQRTPEVAYAEILRGVSLSDVKRQIERECIGRALQESNGNITKASILLGMKRPRLSQLVKQYELGISSEEEES
jgi:DNA-binding NtrC family response regulator